MIQGEAAIIGEDMSKWLLQAYENRNKAAKTSGVYELFSKTENMIIKNQFDNVCV